MSHAVQNNLPLQLSSFVGRAREIAEVSRLLDPSGFPNPKGLSARLITLTGAGGSGKTRLAIEVAAACVGAGFSRPDAAGAGQPCPYDDGVWLVDLAPLADPALVPQRLATTLDVREQPDQPLLTTLINYLRDKHLLLLLDNCEHLIEACAQLTETLLHACPHLTILATSREALNVEGEQTYRVPSLSLPSDFRSPSDFGSLIQYEAVRLFVQRAQAVQPHFVLTEHNAPAIAHICRQLDGIPLALELAAARVKALSVEQIAAHLDESLNLLTGGKRTALPRQQTMRATLDWSHSLLTEPERVLFRRLAVFAGGWTLEAAEAVCGSSQRSVTSSQTGAVGAVGSLTTAYWLLNTADVLDLLTRLIDKSLVLAEERDGETRYRMLEPVRQYAREQLRAGGEEQHIQTRHLDFFADFAETAELQLRGPQQLAWLMRLESEHDNLRGALEWALRERLLESGLRLAAAAAWFWMMRGYLSESGARLTALLAHAATGVKTKAYASALSAASILTGSQGDFASAYTYGEESIALWRTLGDKQGLAQALRVHGLVLVYRGELTGAWQALEECVALCHEIGDKWNMAYALRYLGNAPAGRVAYAEQCLRASLSLARQLGDQMLIGMALTGLGWFEIVRENYAAARPYLAEALTLRQAVGDKPGVATVLPLLGRAARGQGDFLAAKTYYVEGLKQRRELGDLARSAGILTLLAEWALIQGQVARAVRWL